MSATKTYTQGEIDGQADEYARLYGRGDSAGAAQARETLAAMTTVERAAAICAGIRNRIDRAIANGA